MTKRIVVISCILCLLLGFSAGLLVPVPWEADSGTQAGLAVQPSGNTGGSGSAAGSSSAEQDALDTTSNYTLLGTACYALQAFRDRDYDSLAALVDPTRGVTFTPYSTVNPEADRTLRREEVARIGKDTSIATWGFVDGSGEPIQMTAEQYMEAYVFDADYTRAPEIGVDQILMRGNALENLTEVYTDCRFTDFTFPGTDGTDWSSLRLVFSPGATSWYLVGVIHSQWTV